MASAETLVKSLPKVRVAREKLVLYSHSQIASLSPHPCSPFTSILCLVILWVSLTLGTDLQVKSSLWTNRRPVDLWMER